MYFKIKQQNLFLFTLMIFFSATISGQDTTIVFDNNYRCSCNIDSINGFPVYEITEVMPEFIGGDEARMKFLQEHIFLPFSSISEGQLSTCVCFVVDTEGNITNICICKRIFFDGFSVLEKSLMKTVAEMPKWKPGEHQGRKVAVKIKMPIVF